VDDPERLAGYVTGVIATLLAIGGLDLVTLPRGDDDGYRRVRQR
jgi:hypothetical protein